MIDSKEKFKMDEKNQTLYSTILGKEVQVVIDRPMGSAHPNYPNLIYPLNYGYIPGVLGGDGEEQDCYILGIDHPISKFQGKVIAIIKRLDDIEEKWVVAKDDYLFSKEEIINQTYFQEKYFKSDIIYYPNLLKD